MCCILDQSDTGHNEYLVALRIEKTVIDSISSNNGE